MPSQRRLKVIGLLVAISICVVFYLTSSASHTRNSEWYTRTVAAMDARERSAKEAADLEVANKLKKAEELAQLKKEEVMGENTVAKAAPDSPIAGLGQADAGKEQRPLAEDLKDAAGSVKEAAGSVKDEIKDAVHGVTDGEKSVAGRISLKDASAGKDDGVAKVGNTGPKPSALAGDKEHGPETAEDHEVEVELNTILKRSPIIIFSKSYCPYSKKAKHILLDTYKIVPAPYVVELDQHPLGPQLQAALAKSTGRRTVPNVLINGKSIGGGDDVADLDHQGKLAETVSSMGGKRIMEVTKLEAKVAQKFKS